VEAARGEVDAEVRRQAAVVALAPPVQRDAVVLPLQVEVVAVVRPRTPDQSMPWLSDSLQPESS
jgi:hypothetical protein